MSDRMIVLLVLYGLLILIAVLQAFRTARNDGYVPAGPTRQRWLNAIYAETRPHSGTRVLVNFVFWVALFLLLVVASHFHLSVKVLAVAGGSPLTPEKFEEYADGELWLLQVWAGIFVLSLNAIAFAIASWARFENKRLRRIKAFILDDLWGAVLNFGSLFMLSGWIQVIHHEIHFLWMLLFSGINVVMYMLFSTDERKERILSMRKHRYRRKLDLPCVSPKTDGS